MLKNNKNEFSLLKSVTIATMCTHDECWRTEPLRAEYGYDHNLSTSRF